MNKIKLFAVLGLVSILGESIGSALAAETYPFEIKKANRAALRAYQKIVPATYMAMPWIYTLEGTSPPMSITKFKGKDFYYGSVCMPHNCGGNSVVFLIAKDASSAYGLLCSENLTKGKEVEFGVHDNAAKQLMGKATDDVDFRKHRMWYHSVNSSATSFSFSKRPTSVNNPLHNPGPAP